MQQQTFYFNYNVTAIQDVMQYVEQQYNSSVYKMHFERGDDVMCALTINKTAINTTLLQLIQQCSK